jgi:hypothetical protein
MKITDYTLIGEYDDEKLIADVNDSIKTGWQPLGGVITWLRDNDGNGKPERWYSQTMVKYDE